MNIFFFYELLTVILGSFYQISSDGGSGSRFFFKDKVEGENAVGIDTVL